MTISDYTKQNVIYDYITPNQDGTWNGAQTLGKKYGVSSTYILILVKGAGYKTRNAAESHANGKRCKPIKNLPVGKSPLCSCGCGNFVNWNQRKNGWNKYVEGHYRKNALYKNKEWLEKEYNSGKTITEIAQFFNVGASSVLNFVKKNKIKLRSHGESLRLRGSVSKERNPAWQGGTTPERQRVYKTNEWKEIIKEVYKRDEYKCVICKTEKTKGVKFHAHHIYSWAKYPEKRTDINNLITVCVNCHKWIHGKSNTQKLYIGK